MKKSFLTQRENAVLTAIDILDELGIQGLTIRELAGRLEVTEGAIYKHFKNKDDILLTILDRFSFYDQTIINAIREQAMQPKEAILFYVRSYAEYYENYPAITAIIFSYDIFRYHAKVKEKYRKIMKDRFDFLVHLMVKAQEQGLLNREISSEVFADIVIGTMKEIMLRWKSNYCNFKLKETIISAIRYIL